MARQQPYQFRPPPTTQHSRRAHPTSKQDQHARCCYHAAEIHCVETLRENVGTHEFGRAMFDRDVPIDHSFMQRGNVDAMRAREMPHGWVAPGRYDRYGS